MDHRPRKRFGQHFLVERHYIERIIDAIAPLPGDRVVEIGPGLGAITRPLTERLAHLHVVELDRDIVARLAQEYPPARLTIHAGDALAFDFASLGPDLRVVGNLPYNISTPLLFHLSRSTSAIRDIHVMLQREVVDRMVAGPGTPEYGRLSVALQYRFDLEKLVDVPAGAFNPPPKVESAFVRLVPARDRPPLAAGEATFDRVLAAAFSQRRKVLRNALRSCIDAAGIEALGIDPGTRAETLGYADFVRLANAAAGYGATRD